MKRFLALLALVLALMAGTAGMASAATLGFDSYPPPPTPSPDEYETPSLPYPPEIAGTTGMSWNNTGTSWNNTGTDAGHLYCTNATKDNTISFTNPTYVNNFQMNGMPFLYHLSGSYFSPDECTFGPMIIEAFNLDGLSVWTKTVTFNGDQRDLGGSESWQTVDVNTADVSKIIFYAPNPINWEKYPDTSGWNPDGPNLMPSIDNLVINEAAAVPIPASVWLLGSGLLALVGLRRKFTR